ncbi:MAG: Uma2 family endonuclease [Acetobacteraceae bacterium]|nr:Uma2 family endonuclease [Acetobacteraceae bacterium]
MNAPLRTGWTAEQFFAWEGHASGRYEFDGFAPVAMTGGSINHSRITGNVLAALRTRLGGGPCEALGPDAGLATAAGAIRYPDALVTCSPQPSGAARTVTNVVMGFEVLSAASGRTDRIVKVREYAAVPSIRRYVILESRSAGLLVFDRADAAETWRATTLTAEDVLRMPEIGVAIPVAEFYSRVQFGDDPATAGG